MEKRGEYERGAVEELRRAASSPVIYSWYNLGRAAVYALLALAFERRGSE